MQLAVISDLHLGQGDATDDFGHSDATFESFLERLENDFDRIVLLGDVWETLTSRAPFHSKQALRLAREAHPRLAARFGTPKYTYIHGNHDIVASAVDGAPSEWLLDANGRRILFTHGHHHDWLVRRARRISESMVWLGAWSRRLGCAALYRAGYWLDTWLSRTNDAPGLDSFKTWALAAARQRSADIVVTGHTHVPSVSQHHGRLYLNSGSCSDGKLTYLAIDTKLDQFDLCQML